MVERVSSERARAEENVRADNTFNRRDDRKIILIK